jgi:hypothetical protein
LGLLATVFWVLGQAQHINEYCTSRVQQPMPEPTGGRPAYMDGPWTVVCEYDGAPTVEYFEPLPFIGAVLLLAVVVGIGVVAFRSAWPRRWGLN